MTDWQPRRVRRRRPRFGAVVAEVVSKTRRTRLRPEQAALERERQIKAKQLLEGGRRKHVDDVGPSTNPEHHPPT